MNYRKWNGLIMDLFDFKELLAEGDLRTDGKSNEVAEIVLSQPDSLKELIDCLHEKNDIIRGHGADALEKVCRKNFNLIIPFVDILLPLAKIENIAMVKWHYAMLFAYLVQYDEYLNDFLNILYQYLQDDSVFVISWAISSLTIFAMSKKDNKEKIIEKLSELRNHQSKAVQNRLQKAFSVLIDNKTIPKSWIKQ